MVKEVKAIDFTVQSLLEGCDYKSCSILQSLSISKKVNLNQLFLICHQELRNLLKLINNDGAGKEIHLLILLYIPLCNSILETDNRNIAEFLLTMSLLLRLIVKSVSGNINTNLSELLPFYSTTMQCLDKLYAVVNSSPTYSDCVRFATQGVACICATTQQADSIPAKSCEEIIESAMLTVSGVQLQSLTSDIVRKPEIFKIVAYLCDCAVTASFCTYVITTSAAISLLKKTVILQLSHNFPITRTVDLVS